MNGLRVLHFRTWSGSETFFLLNSDLGRQQALPDLVFDRIALLSGRRVEDFEVRGSPTKLPVPFSRSGVLEGVSMSLNLPEQ